MKLLKVLFVTTISNTVNAFLVPHIKMLMDQNNQVDVAFNLEQDIKQEILDLGCGVHIIPFQRFPLSKDNYLAYKELKLLIRNEQYDLVHTHTPVASAIVRQVCRSIKGIKVFYTAHGFHFYTGAPIANWLIYYPVEKLLAKHTDVLITINKEDFERAKRSFHAKRVEYIPGIGFNTKIFNSISAERSAIRKALDLPEDAFVVLSVGELNNNKNHSTIIRAIAMLNNPKIHYVICGEGPLKDILKSKAEELGVKGQVHVLGFRNDIAEICVASDVFAFPSIREGLGLAALEAMAAGLPVVASDIRGVTDYSVNGRTGFTCNPTDAEGFAQAIETLSADPALCKKMGNTNIDEVARFDLEFVLDRMRDIYGGV